MRASIETDVAVLVFSRAPQPGGAKTRLIPRLGAWGAARLQARLTRRAVQTARAAGVGAVELHVTPARGHAFFRMLGKEVPVRNQKGGHLGERMHAAAETALRRHRAVIIIGSDCPSLRSQDLRQAARWLCGGCDAVLAPAEDGGYALIGLRKVSPDIFEDIAWGAADVYSRTTANLAARGYHWRALRTVWDIDRPEDLDRLRSLRFSSAPRQSARR